MSRCSVFQTRLCFQPERETGGGFFLDFNSLKRIVSEGKNKICKKDIRKRKREHFEIFLAVKARPDLYKTRICLRGSIKLTVKEDL